MASDRFWEKRGSLYPVSHLLVKAPGFDSYKFKIIQTALIRLCGIPNKAQTGRRGKRLLEMRVLTGSDGREIGESRERGAKIHSAHE